MHIAITGANGFVGRALAKRLTADARLCNRPLTRITLLDISFDAGQVVPEHVYRRAGDIADSEWLRSSLDGIPLDAVFHLASIPGGTAEQNYALARRVNIDATTQLLEMGKAQVDAGGPAPLFIFASTIAVFGQMPELVTDDTPLAPIMTYGAQKLIGEVLVSDFSRRGWVDGRSLRLPGVLARPPARTGQLSAFMSDIIRELAAGRAYTCPTSPRATTWASSLPCVIDNLLHAAGIENIKLQARRTLNLPTLRFSMAELVTAIATVHGTPAHSLVSYAPDERIETMFGRFPRLETSAADALGFVHDGQLVRLVERALDEA